MSRRPCHKSNSYCGQKTPAPNLLAYTGTTLLGWHEHFDSSPVTV